MSKLTPYRQYPYPIETVEGRGALDVQQQALAVDLDLHGLSVDWSALDQSPAGVLRPTSNVAGIPANVFFPFSMTTGAVTARGGFCCVGSLAFTPSLWGYYLVDFNVALQTSGTINANTIRVSIARYMKRGTGGFVQQDQFRCDEVQSDGIAYMASSFVVLLTDDYDLQWQVLHANTSSTCTIVAAETRASFVRLSPLT